MAAPGGPLLARVMAAICHAAPRGALAWSTAAIVDVLEPELRLASDAPSAARATAARHKRLRLVSRVGGVLLRALVTQRRLKKALPLQRIRAGGGRFLWRAVYPAPHRRRLADAVPQQVRYSVLGWCAPRRAQRAAARRLR